MQTEARNFRQRLLCWGGLKSTMTAVAVRRTLRAVSQLSAACSTRGCAQVSLIREQAKFGKPRLLGASFTASSAVLSCATRFFSSSVLAGASSSSSSSVGGGSVSNDRKRFAEATCLRRRRTRRFPPLHLRSRRRCHHHSNVGGAQEVAVVAALMPRKTNDGRGGHKAAASRTAPCPQKQYRLYVSNVVLAQVLHR